MKIKTTLFMSCAIMLGASGFAQAAATDEEATHIKTVLESYLSATEGVVSVEPDGDGYAVKLDMTPLTDSVAKSSSLVDAGTVNIKISPIEFKMANLGDGKWQLNEDQPLSLDMDLKDKGSAQEKVEKIKVSGVFDEKLGTFATLTGELTNLTIAEKVADPAGQSGDVNATVKGLKIEQTATAAADGGADLTIKYTLDGLNETIAFAGQPDSGQPPLNVVVAAAGGTYGAAGKSLKAKPVLNLLAFFVAHQSKELITKDQDQLKKILTDGLPIFANLKGTMKLNAVKVTTQFGEFGMEAVEIGADMNGLVKDGKFGEKVAFTGLSYPAALVPPWATGLVPKSASFDIMVTDFDAANPANLILGQLDLSKENPLPDGFGQVLLPALLPKGAVTIALNPSNISNDSYAVKLSGSMTAGPSAQPSGKATINAKGLDEIMKIVQAAPPEAGLQQGMAMIIAAKGIGKAESDGTVTWNIEASADGKFLVNGIDPTKLK